MGDHELEDTIAEGDTVEGGWNMITEVSTGPYLFSESILRGSHNLRISSRL